ncbi:MAG TPA: sugar phosphate isomerase/epimerase family protein [Candidatus Acidoferrales bacterium]|nr:sugar phosphate isomerase/epimerase family protein [Candidatus Acidoferrales bacterium]
MNRREVLALPLAAAAFSAPAQTSPRFIKGICSIIFPKEMPRAECFAQAKSAGFDAIELAIGNDLSLDISHDDARRLADAADKAGIRIATLWVSEPLHENPLNSPDPAARARGVDAVRRAIAIATDLNCGALLLYAVRLGNGAKLEVGSQDTWDRYTAELTKVIPDAAKAKVLLNPENVWNKFLLSPLEMRSFVDQFHSPWVGTHFDAGNVMQYGYPEDWILTLGKRIKRIHFKDFKLAGRGEAAHFADLLEGDINWKAVMAALVETGYNGFISPEIGRNARQTDQLKQVSAALDKILAMA